MIWRPAFILLAMIVLPISGHTTDTVLPQARKKFHLHAPGIAFKVSPSNVPRPIARPADQSIGMMTQQEPNSFLELSAVFDPPLSLPSNRFIWSGGATGQGPSIPVGFGSEGNRTVNLTITDPRAPDKTSSASIRVRFVSATTEADLCSPQSPDTAPLCPGIFFDAQTASAWATSETANLRWGWLPHPEPRDNGRSNAAKHAYWNVLMTRDFGAAISRMFSDAHERDPFGLGFGLNDGSPHNGSVMDLDNNLRGRQIAAGLTFTTTFGDDADGQDAVVAAILAGTLTVIDDATPTSDGNVANQGLLQASYP